MACDSERKAVDDAIRDHGVISPEFRAVYPAWVHCIGDVQRVRDERDADWDEIMMKQLGWLSDFCELVIGPLPVPPGPEFETRGIDVRNKIFADVETALIFSQRIEQAFQESGIQLEDNETFACFVYVRERPTDVSEVTAPTFLASHPEARSLLNIIMAPEPTQQVMEALEKGEYAKATAT